MAGEPTEQPPLEESLSKLYAAARDQVQELGKDAHEVCVDAAPLVGDLTGKMYGFGAMRLTDSPATAKLVDTVIDSTVSRGWPDTCDLPSNLTAATKDVAEALGEKTMPLFDSLANLVGEIVTDVRQEVVEQGWFGRTMTGPDKYESFVSDRCGVSPDAASSPSLEQSRSVGVDR